MNEVETFELDDMAVACVVMCLQKALTEDVDIRQLFKELRFAIADDKKLVVINPPALFMSEDTEEEAMDTDTARKIAQDVVPR